MQVATVLDQFDKFLGPELKSVTGESAGIDEIIERVDGLALPLCKVRNSERRRFAVDVKSLTSRESILPAMFRSSPQFKSVNQSNIALSI